MTCVWLNLIRSIKACLLVTFACGVIYPLLLGIVFQGVQWIWPSNVFLHHGVEILRSTPSGFHLELCISEPCFLGRPSASGGDLKNSGPRPVQIEGLKEKWIQDRKALLTRFGLSPQTLIPTSAVMASGSSLDLHIEVSYANLQAPYVSEQAGLELPLVLKQIQKISRRGILCVVCLNQWIAEHKVTKIVEKPTGS